MCDSRNIILDDSSIEIASSSEGIADFREGTTTRRRSVSPTFLHALGLMKITTGITISTSVVASKSRAPKTDENAGSYHTSQSKSVEARSNRAKKRSHATSFDKHQSKPVVVVKKPRKPAAPATKKRITEKKQHKATPPARKVSSSAPKSTDKPAKNLSELISAADEGIWRDILDSDFKSINYTMQLKNCQFTEEEVEVIQKSFHYECRMFFRRPKKRERFMKTHECIDCHYTVSHECMSMGSVKYWNFGGNALSMNLIQPEVITMCQCNFTIFHSHKVQQNSKLEAELPKRSPLPRPSPFVENERSENFGCSRCCMNMSITNRNKNVCYQLVNFINLDDPIRKKFFDYICNNLDYEPKNHPDFSEFYSCRNLCCMLFHRCAQEVVRCKSFPMQFHRPINVCYNGVPM